MAGLYLTKDLFFASRVIAAARALGGDLQVVGTVDALLDRMEQESCSLVLLDLDSPGADPAALVGGLRRRVTEPPLIVAFGSHIHEARLAAARDAGCDFVLTRGQFDRQMREILQTRL
jgi:CheY-like chemotaxis protein